MGLSQEQKDKIVIELNKKTQGMKCPVCGYQHFSLVDGYTRRILNDKIDQIQIGGINVPSVSIICDNCGFILDFAIGTLGFLKKQEDVKNEKR